MGGRKVLPDARSKDGTGVGRRVIGWQPGMSRVIECPQCGESVAFEKGAQVLTCPGCQVKVRLKERTGSRQQDGETAEIETPGPPDDKGRAGRRRAVSPPRRRDTSEELPRRLRNYELIEEIGRGGMGIVYRARHVDLDREVALKLLKGISASDADALRFVAEAQVTGQLEHPNIVPVHEIGTDENGFPFFVMKLVRGRALSDILIDLRNGEPEVLRRYPLNRVLSIFCEICQAVAFAHNKGILHRDLKPANVMIGDYGEVQVMDWGLAKILGRKTADEPKPEAGKKRTRGEGDRVRAVRTGLPESQPGFVAGTPEYMSPEQAAGDPTAASPRSDIYSLGAILFEILSYRPPHLDHDTRVLMHKVATEPVRFPPPGGFRPKISKQLRAVTMKALAHKAESRYASAQALLRDVRAILELRPVTACPDTIFDKAARLVRRHGSLVGTIAAALVLLSIGASVAFWRLESEAQATARQKEKALEEARLREEAEKEKWRALEEKRKEEKARRKAEEATKSAQRRELDLANKLASSTRMFPQALDLIKRRQYGAAARKLQHIVDTDPHSPVSFLAFFYLGQSYRGMATPEDGKKAITAFEAANTSARHHFGIGDPRALLSAGEVAWRYLNDEKRALTLYNMAAREDPGNPYGIMGQAFVHVLKGRAHAKNLLKSEDAQKKLKAAARKALDLCREAIQRGRFLWEPHYVAGTICGDLDLKGCGYKDLNAAYNHFSEALNREPNLPELWLNRAMIAERLNRKSEVLSDYNNALRLQPDFLPALIGRGAMLIEHGRPEEALKDLDAAFKAAPGDFDVRSYRGAALEALKKWKAAEAEFEAAINLNNQIPQVWHQLARTRFALKKYAQSAKDAARAFELDPLNLELLKLEAESLLLANEHQAAATRFQELLKKTDKHAIAWLHLAEAQLALGDQIKALAAYKKFLTTDPDRQDIRLRIIQLLIADSGAPNYDPKEAVEHAQEAQRRGKKKDPVLMVALAEALWANKNAKEALKTIEEAYGAFPVHPKVRACRQKLRSASETKTSPPRKR